MKSYYNDYIEYLQSPEWEKRTQEARKRADYKCERCGVRGVKLEVHHLTYDNLGEEKDEDLKVVCAPCHKKEDTIRVRKDYQARKNRAFPSYAEKRWGEDWQERIDEDEAYRIFSDWFDSKG